MYHFTDLNNSTPDSTPHFNYLVITNNALNTADNLAVMVLACLKSEVMA